MTHCQHGTICWLEIPVLSASRAAAFYTAVFAWDCSLPPGSPTSASSSTTTPFLNNGGPATTIHTFYKKSGQGDDALHGAFIQVPEGCLIRACAADTGEMAVLTTFAVESIEETLSKVVELGGRMHSYVSIPLSSVYYFFYFFCFTLSSSNVSLFPVVLPFPSLALVR